MTSRLSYSVVLEKTEINLKLQIGTPFERRQAIEAFQFILVIEDCNQVSWQAIMAAILASVCVALTGDYTYFVLTEGAHSGRI